MKILSRAAILAAAALLTACVPTEKTNIGLSPNLEDPDTIELDFIELNNDTIESFGEIIATPYTFITELDIDGDNSTNTITVNAEAVDGADEEDAMHFAAAVLRHMNDSATNQYISFNLSTQEDFGNLYETYGVEFVVTNQADGSEIYSLSIEPGDDIPLDPDIEAYEEEWLEYMELYMTGIEDEETMWDDENEAADEAAEDAGEAEDSEASDQ